MTCPVYQSQRSVKPWTRAGIVPVAYAYNPLEIQFLLGKEHFEPGWSGSNKWNDFGGGSKETDSSPNETAAREAYEESMGLFGTKEELLKMIAKTGTIKIGTSYVFFPWWSSIDEKGLPNTFRRVFEYISKCITKSPSGGSCILGCPQGHFEKTDIKWFRVSELNSILESNPSILQSELISFIKVYLESI